MDPAFYPALIADTEIRIRPPASLMVHLLLSCDPRSVLGSPDVDPYRVAPTGAASPYRYLVPSLGIGPKPGVAVAWIPVSPELP